MNYKNILYKYDWLVIFIFAYCLFSINAIYPFYTRGEAREGLVVNAMFEQNNFILPLRNGVDIPSKPPLFHWIAAFFIYLFKSKTEYFYRIPSMLSSAFALSYFTLFSKKYLDKKLYILFPLILMTSLEWLKSSSAARVDLLFSSILSVSLFLIYELIEENKKFSIKLLPITILLTLCFLTKGPAGLVLPWTIVFIYLLISRKLDLIIITNALCSSLLSALLSLIWYFFAFKIGGERFLDVHLMRENVARVVGMDDYDTGHKGNFFTVFVLLFTGMIPWSFLLLGCFSSFRKDTLQKEGNSLLLFCSTIIIFFLLFFGLVSSKRSVYLLGAYPAIVFLLLWSIANQNLKFSNVIKRIIYYLSHFLFSTIVLLFLITSCSSLLGENLIINLLHRLKEKDLNLVLCIVGKFGLLKFISFLLLVYLFMKIKKLYFSQDIQNLIKFTFFQIILLSTYLSLNVVLPLTIEFSANNYFADIKNNFPNIGKVYQFADDYYIASFYFNKNLEKINSLEKLSPGEYNILLSKTNFEKIKSNNYSIEILKESQKYAIYGKDKFIFIKLNK